MTDHHDAAPAKLPAGAPFPDITLPRVGGGEIAPARVDGWRMLVVYRGKHCPLCKRYLTTLDGLREDFAKQQVEVMAVSADPEAKAAAEVKEQGWSIPIGYDLSMEQMRTLGLYVSSPRSPEETDRPFAEPAVFVINPQGAIQVVDVSNAPFARPDLSALLAGLTFVRDKDYPIRGTLA